MQRKAAVFLWFESEARAAADFYASIFPDSAVEHVTYTPDLPGGTPGRVQVVEMTICGLPYVLLNAGPPQAPPNDSYSLQVYTDDQAETDRLWDAIVGHGGAASQCGWCRDRWGYRWQITPRILMDALSDPDRAASARAQAAMLTMQKIDIAAIAAALRG